MPKHTYKHRGHINLIEVETEPTFFERLTDLLKKIAGGIAFLFVLGLVISLFN